MKNEYQLYIDGGWRGQTDGCVREDLEPATGRALFTVHRAGPGDVERALQSAQDAFALWRVAILQTLWSVPFVFLSYYLCNLLPRRPGQMAPSPY